MRKRTAVILPVVAVLAVALIIAYLSTFSWFYSDETHTKRVRELVENRYMTETGEYTDYELFPLFNENDELAYFLVEFEPFGYVYILINETCFFQFFGGYSMYTRDHPESEVWYPYTVEKGAEGVIQQPDGTMQEWQNRKFKYDENGDIISYRDSHFKAAGTGNERRYLLEITSIAELGRSHGYIPAVKRGDAYLNLVSMEELQFTPGMVSDRDAISDISFIPKNNFDL